ncbi:cytochrome b/b6 domain-containing protein [Geoalkalibacter halelectricus]|uniref:Cytochrome b/b6 domain-containing protein n=1 Tax=Geoalkalibacter halelectricus TaxID=2847045 RepID=A0ABY5ZHT3_9BACT|nr:cytochrome b/b6 domain-containing protein [Geoalkalibacter halelectricus]MDO3377773.1 cytochrome b/b6 domain-containing protein [Geoalkalibacter halelectricus]UWZ78633.1 cytochrome b/b6 domain-containing protein [Geoalkalibacter halelectricus]
MAQSKYIYLQPTPIRIWHWLNALGFIALILSGIQIRYPEVNIFGSYRAAIELHNTAGIVVSVSFCLWLIYYLVISRKLVALYVPTRDDIQRGLWRQAMFYFFNYFRGKPNPHHATPESKFNPMQKSAYLVIMMVLVPLVIVSGLLLLNIGPMRQVVMALGGVKMVIGAHFLLSCGLTAFLFTHVYLATLGQTAFAYFKPMWTGWEKVDSHHAEEGH